MASAQPPQGQPRSLHAPVPAERLDRVGRARRIEPACAPEQPRQTDLITAHEEPQSPTQSSVDSCERSHRLSLRSVGASSNRLLQQARHEARVGFFDVFHLRSHYLLSSDQHQIRRHMQVRTSLPEDLSQHSFRPVTRHRVAYSPARNDTNPKIPMLTLDGEGNEERAHYPLPVVVSVLEFTSAQEPRRSRESGSRHTARRWRPFRRRLEITARPAFDFIRTRKPWVFFRRRRLGWKVLFIETLLRFSSAAQKRRQCGYPRRNDRYYRPQMYPVNLSDRGSLFRSASYFFLSPTNPYARLPPSSGRQSRALFFNGDGVPRMGYFPQLLIFLWKYGFTPVFWRPLPKCELSRNYLPNNSLL